MGDNFFTSKPPVHLAARLEKFQEKRKACSYHFDNNFASVPNEFSNNMDRRIELSSHEISNGSDDETE